MGRLTAARTFAGVARRLAFERPFRDLGRARDRRERLSRKQVLGAILLYRELCARVGRDRALDICGQVIEAGAVVHLRKTLGHINGDTLAQLPSPVRTQRVHGWMKRFFTATAEVNEVTATQVRFTVHACALVRLATATGHPELAPAFCRGDARYFASLSPPVHLDRPTTLAAGGESCPFTLTLGPP